MIQQQEKTATAWTGVAAQIGVTTNQRQQNEGDWQLIDRKGETKQKMPQHTSTGSVGKGKKHSKDTELFIMTFEMMMIENWFGDGWHKCIIDLFVEQRIEEHYLMTDGIHKRSLNWVIAFPSNTSGGLSAVQVTLIVLDASVCTTVTIYDK